MPKQSRSNAKVMRGYGNPDRPRKDRRTVYHPYTPRYRSRHGPDATEVASRQVGTVRGAPEGLAEQEML